MLKNLLPTLKVGDTLWDHYKKRQMVTSKRERTLRSLIKDGGMERLDKETKTNQGDRRTARLTNTAAMSKQRMDEYSVETMTRTDEHREQTSEADRLMRGTIAKGGAKTDDSSDEPPAK